MQTAMSFETVVQDANVEEREYAEVFEARANEERAWLDAGGIDELAAYFGATDTDDLNF